jgi:predicted Zn-dependent protease
MNQQNFTDSDRAPRRATALESGPVLYGVVALVFLALVAAVGALGFLTLRWLRPTTRPFVARDVSKLNRRQGKVFLIPFDNFPAAELEELARQYAARYGTPVEVGPRVRLPANAYDEGRGQLVAEYALATLRVMCPAESCEPRNVVIGVTADDMYIRGKDWNYAYSYRFETAAVVSTARMGESAHFFAWKVSPSLRQGRLRKMVAKNIGILYYHLPLRRDPRSLLYYKVTGPRDLDDMGEEF